MTPSSCTSSAVYAEETAVEDTTTPSPLADTRDVDDEATTGTDGENEGEGGDEGPSIGAIAGIIAAILLAVMGAGVVIHFKCKEVHFSCCNKQPNNPDPNELSRS